MYVELTTENLEYLRSVSLWQIRTHEADGPKRDRLDTGIDNVYWCPSYGMYLAKYEGKRRRTKDIDAARQFARYGDNLDNPQESPDEVAGAEPKDAEPKYAEPKDAEQRTLNMKTMIEM